MDHGPAPRARPSCDWRLPREGPAAGAASGVPVALLMSAHTVCVSPDLPAGDLRALLLERDLVGVPVVGEDGVPLGVASRTDLVRALDGAEELVPDADGLKVADLMTPHAYTLPESAPVSQVAAFMAYKGIHCVPIVGGDGTLVGVLSALDVLRWLGEREGYLAE